MSVPSPYAPGTIVPCNVNNSQEPGLGYVLQDGKIHLLLQITADGTLRRHSITQEMIDLGYQVELNNLLKVDP